MERQEFRKFVQPLLSQNPYIQALEWIPRIHASERTAYEKAAQLDGFPDFQITEMNAEGELIRATFHDEYFPVYFVEPFPGNKAALGFDLISNPRRKEALLQARDSNQMVATARITLVQEKGKQFGLRLVC